MQAITWSSTSIRTSISVTSVCRRLMLRRWNNRDPRKNGESADGLAIKEGSGEGNIVRGLRAWNNVDDGVDFLYAPRAAWVRMCVFC